MTGRKEHNTRVGRRAAKRSLQAPTRTAGCGLVTIIVDTDETEKNYFNGLKTALSSGTQISIQRAKKTEKIVEFALEHRKGAFLPSAEIWLVFDRDELRVFDEIIDRAKNSGLNVAWSNPCFEIWLHSYLGEMPSCDSAQQCIRHFKDAYKRATNKEYKKNEPELFALLERFGSRETAVRTAKRKYQEAIRIHGSDAPPSRLTPASAVFELIEHLTAKQAFG